MPKQILIADDEESFRFAASLSLRQEGYEVSEAGNGEIAFTMIMDRHLRGFSYDLIILDIQMPVVSGTDLFELLHRHGITTPVIFITGYADEKVICKVSNQTKTRLLRKPFASEEMVAIVDMMVSEL
jgi:DNA-binding response OmpR family regulator